MGNKKNFKKRKAIRFLQKQAFKKKIFNKIK